MQRSWQVPKAHIDFRGAAADKTTNAGFEELFFGSWWVMASFVPKIVLCVAGFLGLALAGWRQHSIPRSAALALGLAAVLSVWPPYPPALIVASIGFVLAVRQPSRRTR